jgi:methylthioribose-1-phosphate isomerase
MIYWRCSNEVLEKLNFFVQRTISWDEKTSSVRIIDQTRLPGELRFLNCKDVSSLVRAIQSMQIRGAPAIGVAGAMGVALSLTNGLKEKREGKDLARRIEADSDALVSARPTAVNLSWGVKEAMEFLRKLPPEMDEPTKAQELISFVKQLADKDVEANKKLSRLGQSLIKDRASILTHCK